MAGRTLENLGKSGRSKDICACFATRKAARAITRFYSQFINDSELGASQHSLLLIIYLAGEISISAMADIAVMDRTTLTRNLKPLVKKGLITIEQGEDRRERIVRITRKGTALLKKTMDRWECAQIELEKRLGSKKFDQFISILGDVMKQVKT